MANTLLAGDYLVADESAYRWCHPFSNKVCKPQRDDIAIFIFPQDPRMAYVKRVIGLPGERVQITNKNVYINGQPYETPQAHFEDNIIIPAPQSHGGSPRDNFGPVVVPPDSYFVLGDNRDHSYDSRFWGFVPLGNFRGKVLYVYFSKDRKDSRIRWNRIGLTVN